MFRQKVILHRLRGAKKIANIFAFSAYAGRSPLIGGGFLNWNSIDRCQILGTVDPR